ncbi:MAG TPA: zinc ribbon domain-containing protein [Pyrinomonadaceae bacterium]|nr:zinc ribbon domain-containing protein [Pyrinomonadaceae bacterium]
MYCPNCGNKNAEGQNFCRSCGLGLEKIAQSLTEQLPAVAVQSLQERKERLERLGVASLSVFGLGIFGFLLYNIFFKLLLTQGPLVATLAVLGAIIFLGSGLVSVILFAKANELKEAAAKRQIGSVTSELLESHQQPTFSITDGTTNLLPDGEPERQRRET